MAEVTLDRIAVLVLPVIRDAVNRNTYSVGSNSPELVREIVGLLAALGYLEYVGYTAYGRNYTAHYAPTEHAREWLALRVVKGGGS